MCVCVWGGGGGGGGAVHVVGLFGGVCEDVTVYVRVCVWTSSEVRVYMRYRVYTVILSSQN